MPAKQEFAVVNLEPEPASGLAPSHEDLADLISPSSVVILVVAGSVTDLELDDRLEGTAWT